MERRELMNILPHREEMLLLDEAEKSEEEALGRLRIRGDEWFLQGHFPGNPVVPGVIQCEILAQSVCVLLAGAMSEDKTPLYTGLNNVKFKNPVRPGDLFAVKQEGSAVLVIDARKRIGKCRFTGSVLTYKCMYLTL